MIAIKVAAIAMSMMMAFDAPSCKVVYKKTAEAEKEAVISEVIVKETVYRIHGVTPPIEWQTALRSELKAKGIEWYMPYAVCQIWQESRWNPKSDNGKDKGITQQKGIYWAARAERYGVKGASVWDVYAQFHVFAAMMSGYLRTTGNDVGKALSLYFYGTGEYAPKYVNDVMAHFDYLQEVTR